MKKIFIILLMSLIVTGCNNEKKNDNVDESKNQEINYKNVKKVTLDGIEIATMLEIADINDMKESVVSESTNTYRFIYNDGAITEDDYNKLIQYLYDNCYGYNSLFGSLSVDPEIGNFHEFYKYSKTDGKAIKITIKESIKDNQSVYDITYKLLNFDDEIYYVRDIQNADGSIESYIDQECLVS